MAFKAESFVNQEFQPRTEAIRLESLADWFDGEPIWTVKSVTASDLARANEAAERRKNLVGAIEAVAGSVGQEKVQATRELLGIDRKETPPDIAKRLDLLVAGSADPVIDMTVAVKLGKTFPIEFMLLTNKVLLLSGQGAVPGKSKPSGKANKSETSSA
jgi:hypothetical protein